MRTAQTLIKLHKKTRLSWPVLSSFVYRQISAKQIIHILRLNDYQKVKKLNSFVFICIVVETACDLLSFLFPAGTRRLYNVALTSMHRHI